MQHMQQPRHSHYSDFQQVMEQADSRLEIVQEYCS